MKLNNIIHILGIKYKGQSLLNIIATLHIFSLLNGKRLCPICKGGVA